LEALDALRRLEGLEARRTVVLRNMCELMREMGRSDEFNDPKAWLKSNVGRTR
jgi:hypothetical protein